MYCRYCGAAIADDSRFCSKCGKRLIPLSSARLAKLLGTLRLKSPYPYFILLVGLFVVWAIGPRRSRIDYSRIKWTFQIQGQIEHVGEDQFRHHLSLIAENIGDKTIAEIPIELIAKIEPQQPAEILSDFLGRKLLIMQSGRSLPLVVVLSGKIDPGEKKLYPFDGVVSGKPPLKVTYEIREDPSHQVLASVTQEFQ